MKFTAFLLFSLILVLSCTSEPKKKAIAPEVVDSFEKELIKGKEIASATFNALSTELKAAMAKGGVSNAVKYCNLAALPITDSLSLANQVTIKRTSDKWRNPKNKPTATELTVINNFKKELTAGRQPKAFVQPEGEQLAFYAPIKTQGLCISCHGKKENISDYDRIEELYPEDLAVGYSVGELRGIWSITFKK